MVSQWLEKYNKIIHNLIHKLMITGKFIDNNNRIIIVILTAVLLILIWIWVEASISIKMASIIKIHKIIYMEIIKIWIILIVLIVKDIKIDH